MPRGIKKEVEKVVEPVVELPSYKDQLLVRREKLLGLINELNVEGANSLGTLEVKLSQVNAELAKL